MDVEDVATQLASCKLLEKVQESVCRQMADKTDDAEQLNMARMLNKLESINILLVGSTGYGKSALVRGLTGQNAEEGGVIPTTKGVTRYSHGTITFIDTKGFETYAHQEFDELDRILREANIKKKVHIAFVLQSAGSTIVASPLLKTMTLLLLYRIPFCSLVTRPYSGNNQTHGHLTEMKRLMCVAAKQVSRSLVPRNWFSCRSRRDGVVAADDEDEEDEDENQNQNQNQNQHDNNNKNKGLQQGSVPDKPPCFRVNSVPYRILDEATGRVEFERPAEGLADLVKFVVEDSTLKHDLGTFFLLSLKEDMTIFGKLGGHIRLKIAELLRWWSSSHKKQLAEWAVQHVSAEKSILSVDGQAWFLWQMLRVLKHLSDEKTKPPPAPPLPQPELQGQEAIDGVAPDGENDDDNLCPICNENQKNVGLVPCGHIFCGKCVSAVRNSDALYHQATTCPTFRRVIVNTVTIQAPS